MKEGVKFNENKTLLFFDPSPTLYAMSSWDMFFDGQDSGLFSGASFGVDFSDFVVDIIAAVAGFPVFWTGF